MVSQVVQVVVESLQVDPCKVQLPLTITHGRSTVTTQPDPPSCELTWVDPQPIGDIGDGLAVWSGVQYEPVVYDDPVRTYDDPSAVYDSASHGVVMRCRFQGHIAGMTAHASAGQVTHWDVECIGGLARLGTTNVNLTRPQERDTARVTAIAAAAGRGIKIAGSQGVQLAAGQVTGDALSALHAVCASTGGLLWQNKDGSFTYGTAKHRTTTTKPVGSIPCQAIESELTWDTDVESIVNEVTVRWGPSTAQGEATHRDNDSIAQPWGVRHADVTTLCAAEADADELGLLVMARRAWPHYGMTNGLLDITTTDSAAARLFSILEVSSPVLIPIPPEPGPTPSNPYPVLLEGWVETWEAGDQHTAQAAFSDQKRWALTTLRTWTEAKTQTYAYWKTGSWLDMMIKEA